jgi:hypothetical protein
MDGRPVRSRPDREQQVLRAGCPEDLLGVVPYLLGFHPTESLVLLAIRRRRVELAARVDLPGAADSFTTMAQWPEVVRRLASAASTSGPGEVVLIGYSTVEGRAEEALDAAVAELGDLPVIEVLHADGRRWWSRRCDDSCCPAEGTPYAVEESRLAAEAVLAGLSPLPDRSALVEVVAGPPPDEVDDLVEEAIDALEQLAGLPRTARADEMRRRVEAAVVAHRDGGSADPDRSSCLRLAALATDLDVRDVAWALIDPTTWPHHLALWTAVVRATPPPLAPAPLCLLGAAAWVGGQGALMVCAFTRALEVRPGYGMARLLADLNTAALPPSLWQEVAGPLRESLGLEVDLGAEGPPGAAVEDDRAWRPS